jgi:hypothetical protein
MGKFKEKMIGSHKRMGFSMELEGEKIFAIKKSGIMSPLRGFKSGYRLFTPLLSALRNLNFWLNFKLYQLFFKIRKG